MMEVLVLVVSMTALLAPQDQDPSQIDELVRQFQSEDLEIRTRAATALAGLDLKYRRTIRTLLAKEENPETRARLADVLRRFDEREGVVFDVDLHLQAQLEKDARAAGARDPAAYVEKRCREAVDFILKIYKPDTFCVYRIHGYRVKSVVERHGRWALPYLLSVLRGGTEENIHVPYMRILLAMKPEDTLPYIEAGLRSENRTFQANAVCFLGNDERHSLRRARIMRALLEMSEDPLALPYGREAAQEQLGFLREMARGADLAIRHAERYPKEAVDVKEYLKKNPGFRFLYDEFVREKREKSQTDGSGGKR